MKPKTTDEIVKIKKIFAEKSMDELPFNIVNEVYDELIRTYKQPMAALMGIYLLGTFQNDNES